MGGSRKLPAGPSCQGPGLGLTTECPPVLTPQNSWVAHAFPASLSQIVLSRWCGHGSHQRTGPGWSLEPSGTARHFIDGKTGLERTKVPTVPQKVGNRAELGPLGIKMSQPLPHTFPALSGYPFPMAPSVTQQILIEHLLCGA